MLNILQFRSQIVRPVLETLGEYSRAAESLVLGTALQESDLHFLRQLSDGPARGIYQMEPATHDDIWENYLDFRPELRNRVLSYVVPERNQIDQLVWNLAYATAMCRVHYLRVPRALPAPDDIPGLAAYWKQFYNTSQGRGRVEEFVQKFEDFVIRKNIS